MDSKEATVLEHILEHRDETLTTHKLSTHLDMPADELRQIIERLEDQLLVMVGAKTPQGHCYDIRPTPHADQALTAETVDDPVLDIGPDPEPFIHSAGIRGEG